ncbi:hypothetical protein HDV03_002890 [Kappamyces sp. JEL0829]|nr:hypothetical protein HDV03_002890 [Kappamyces sp. JEL0829]
MTSFTLALLAAATSVSAYTNSGKIWLYCTDKKTRAWQVADINNPASYTGPSNSANGWINFHAVHVIAPDTQCYGAIGNFDYNANWGTEQGSFLTGSDCNSNTASGSESYVVRSAKGQSVKLQDGTYCDVKFFARDCEYSGWGMTNPPDARNCYGVYH